MFSLVLWVSAGPVLELSVHCWLYQHGSSILQISVEKSMENQSLGQGMGGRAQGGSEAFLS